MKTENAKNQTVSQANKPAETAKNQPVAKVKKLNFEQIGEKLYAENTSFEKACEHYAKLYAERGKMDATFVAARTKIYLRIAEKRAIAKQAEKAAK